MFVSNECILIMKTSVVLWVQSYRALTCSFVGDGMESGGAIKTGTRGKDWELAPKGSRLAALQRSAKQKAPPKKSSRKPSKPTHTFHIYLESKYI